ncbi:MAG TPA: alpha/beta hydrolase [Alphaproteobacteria bacterium]
MPDERSPKAAAKVWGPYTQVELDAQYYQMSALTEAERQYNHHFKTTESSRVRAALAKDALLDVAYGDSLAERLDVFRPPPRQAAAGTAIQVYFHGGDWKAGKKEDVSFIAEPFVAKGVMFVAVGYGHVPDITLDEHVRQARAAVAWVYRNAANLGGDPERLFLSGHSSGGHVCAEVAVTDWPKLHGLPGDVVKGAAPISGVFDLAPVRLSSRHVYLSLDRAAVDRLSPIQQIPERALPIVVGYGTRELEEFKRQSRDFAAAWRRSGQPCLEVELPGLNHFAVNHAFANPQGPLLKAIFTQMNV